MEMKKTLCRLAALALAALACSCDGPDEIDPIALRVAPDQNTEVGASSGDVVRYTIDLYAHDTEVAGFSVTSYDVSQGTVALKDTAFRSGDTRCYFDYVVPSFDRDSLVVELTFTAKAANGQTAQLKRAINVTNAVVLLAEKTGIVLRDGGAGLPDAISLAEPTQPFCLASQADTVKAQRADLVLRPGDDGFATLSLYSCTGAKFVRNNSFDYASATALGVQQVYGSSTRSDEVLDLRVNDIVLVGHGAKAQGAFRVTGIVRSGSDSERSVSLSFKALN